MQIHERKIKVEGVRLLALDGGLDHTTTDEFVRKMDALLEDDSRHLVLDLSRLTYASSLGLAALVQVHHHFAGRGGRIAFANLHSAVATVLHAVRLDRLFDLYPTVEEAVRSLAPASDASGSP